MELPDQVIEALARKQKIEAIKRLREQTGVGLAEARDAVEAFLRGPANSPGATKSSGRVDTELSDKVIDALLRQQKVEAIKLLRAESGIGLAEAKAAVEAYRPKQSESSHPQQPLVERQSNTGAFANILAFSKPLALIGTFVWMMVNIFTVIGSLIILLNEAGYQAGVFTIDNVFYQDDHESGLSWGFNGRLADKKERMLAPALADAKSLKSRGLNKLYPEGTKLKVWYNPEVTDTLFQNRSLHIMPYVADIFTEEKKQILWWGKFCVLPFFIAMMLSVSGQKPKAMLP